MIRLAVVGLGYWGPNLLRNLAGLPDATVTVLCDAVVSRAENARQRFCSGAAVQSDYRKIDLQQVDAVVIATPIRTHFTLASYFLNAGRHVLVEKPLAGTTTECQQLIEIAQRNEKTLMVGHVFEYSAAVHKVKQYLEEGELGKPFYIHSQRVNLGRIQSDVNALWSFAPHDISIVNSWLGTEPLRLAAKGFCYLNHALEDVVFVTLEYPGGIGVHLHLGWLDPVKVRRMTLVGSKKMIVYDDVSPDTPIRLYDRGIVQLDRFLEAPGSFAEFKYPIRVGDVVIPTLEFSEPLAVECRHFIDCVTNGKRPKTDGTSGLRVVRVLEAADRSLKENGAWLDVEMPEVTHAAG